MIPSYSVVLLFLLFLGRSKDVRSYSKVLTMGAGNSENGPKIYKAMNMDLIFPKTFNSSEHVISTTQTATPQRFNEPFESLLSTADDRQFTPGYSSLQTTSSSSERVTEPRVAAAAETTTTIPTNHYHPSFVISASANSNNADNLEEEEESEVTLPPPATGRAVDYRPAYPFSQLLTPNSKGYSYSPSASSSSAAAAAVERSRPVSMSSKSKSGNGQQRVVYPSYQASRIPSRAEIDKLSGKGQFSDRFTPAEGVASNTFKLLKQNRNKPSIARPIGQTSNKVSVSSFLPNQDLYAFPPNINSRYPAPTTTEIKQALPSDAITSYLPPAAGPLDNTEFVGPISPDLLPESMKNPKPADGANVDVSGYQYSPPKGDENSNGGDGYHYNPPKSSMDDTDDIGDDQAPPPDAMDDGDAGDVGGGMMDESPPPDHHHDDHHHDHHEIGGYVDGKEYPTPPPGYLEEHGHEHDHPRHHEHHPDIEFSHGPIFHDHHPHDYPDIVYDDYHHGHHHHVPMTTEPPPPPPAPEQPRVKKYSYFYIGRKLWYIPLYFTVWFTFYVLWLILKSIARHKVNLPNHYVTRRSIDEIMEHREARESIDKLTVQVMDGIEKFKLRYLG
ncbi:uncharacterized protein LOC129942037 [Eupeodes corollae]|uniref:uncharacterized protein LOC129942037 n=1 Tax=Eupeodes corollae TaxID=290404 RepID=UPI00249342F8|nr:uncharacterized protein LOC129942037 [Eupeodes corollae]